jgi:hypothetical protein
MMMKRIYVALLDEGTECWRPVQAEHLGDDLYRIIGEKPSDEVWRFGADDIVKCKVHVFQNGSSDLVAYESASEPK